MTNYWFWNWKGGRDAVLNQNDNAIKETLCLDLILICMDNFIDLKLSTSTFKNDFETLINYPHLSIKIICIVTKVA
ncbi:unnamed protein product, partial [Vitis vinifera]|uniref:Uncharacterized protein n=1 Tax=Vitis vinifera TaxID=29760 RepID=D7U955_VITVI